MRLEPGSPSKLLSRRHKSSLTPSPKAAAAAEEADKAKSYADYLAEQAAKGRGELGVKEARAPNAGSKDKKSNLT